MARSFLTNIDLNKNQLVSAVIDSRGSAPGSPLPGQVYYNNTLKTVYYHDGTNWLPLGSTTSGSGAPGTTPSATGLLYLDTSNSILYAAKGTTNSADWVLTIPGSDSTTGLANPASAGGTTSPTQGTSVKYARQDHTHSHAGADHNNIRLQDLSTTLTADFDLSGQSKTILVKTPTASTEVANKSYVDTVASGMNAHDAVVGATTVDLGSIGQGAITYTPVTSGVDDYITPTNNGVFDIDGVASLRGSAWATGDRVLVKNQTVTSQNGIYYFKSAGDVGSASTKWKLTRATDADQTPELGAGDFCYVLYGTANGKFTYVQTNKITTIGTDSITYSVLANGNLSGTVAVAQGGTGATTLTSNGVVLGNGTSAVQVTSAGAANTVLRVPSGGGAPAFGSIDVSQSAAVTGILSGANGGTGVANTGKTITLGGNLTTSGAFTTTLTVTGNTSVTLPTSGTLAILGSNTFTGSQTLRAGTATAATAPLYFTSGTNLTTAVNGAMEYDGTRLYFTPSSATRKAVALTDAAGQNLDSTITGSSLTSLGTIATGTWNGSVIGATYGGTGNSAAPTSTYIAVGDGTKYVPTAPASVRSTLAVPGKYSVANPAITVVGSQATWTVTHNLGSVNVIVQVRSGDVSATGGTIQDVDITYTDANNVTLQWTSSTNITAGSYTVTVIG